MPHNLQRLAPLAVIAAVAVIASCNNDDNNIVNVVPAPGAVRIQDECDSASFNAALGAGTCTRQGTVTFTAFNNELAANKKVATWLFVPSVFSIRVAQTIAATNFGGEKHTFTEVAAFGGGIVPALNTASGNLTVAPECAALPLSAQIAPGGTFTTGAPTATGTKRYQCCIHPWMRAVVTVQ